MKQWKKVFTALVLAFTVMMAVPAVPQANILTKAEAAVIKINKKSATVSVGKTLKLKSNKRLMETCSFEFTD